MQAAAAATTTEVTELSVKPRPLDGLRVIDLSRFIAGPFAARLLSDLGADVVKIEPPAGDVTRLFGVVREGLSGLYVQQNAGKRNLCVDLKTAGAAELVLDLVRKADVVIENFRPGVMDRLGLSWNKLSEANPRVILLSISGFGQTGPEAHRQAYAPIIHAESGWIGRRGEMLGEPPRDSVVSFADSITGLHGLIALLAAVQLRGRTGRGQHLDIAMLDSWLATDDYVHYLLDGASAPVFQGGEVFAAPGFHAVELAGSLEGDEGELTGTPRAARGELAESGLEVSRLGDAGEILDPRAKNEYRQRLVDLRKELEEAKARNDSGHASRIEEELEILTRELAGALGLGGRDRKSASASERARVSLTKRISASMKLIAEHHPSLARHLRNTIHTGTFFSYTPDPRSPIPWAF